MAESETNSVVSTRLARYGTREVAGPHELGELVRVNNEADGEGDLILLAPHALPNRRSRRQFKRQIQAACLLDHGALVPVRDGATDREEDRSFIATARHPGSTLRLLLDKGPLYPNVALRFTLDLLNGLTYAHHHRFVHGGLSPHGVYVEFVEDEPRARISAFGLPHLIGRPTETPHGVVRANPNYAAPEVIKGEPTGPWTDVYSVAVLLFEMLTGRHPVPGEGEERLGRLVSEVADDLPVEIIPDAALEAAVKAALARALRKAPSERFQSARDFALALRPGGAQHAEECCWADAPADGAPCDACAVKIPSAADRTWSTQHSDRPFRCAVCDQSFCGTKHWDRQSQTCYTCRGLPLPAPKRPPPADLPLVVATDLLEDRREALRALLSRDSAMDWMRTVGGSVATGAIRGEDESEAPRPLAPPAAPAPRPASTSEPEPDRSQVAKRSKKSSRQAARPKLTKASLEDPNADVKEALIDAWAEARRDENARENRRLKERAESKRAAAETSEIPRAAQPKAGQAKGKITPHQPAYGGQWKPEPLPPEYSSQGAGKAILLVFAMAVGMIYLGVTARMAKDEHQATLAASAMAHDAALVEVNNWLEDAVAEGNQLTDKLTGVATEHEQLKTRFDEAVRRADGLDAEFEDARTRHGEAEASAKELRESLAVKEADWGRNSAGMEEDLGRVRGRLRKERAQYEAAVKAMSAEVDTMRNALTLARERASEAKQAHTEREAATRTRLTTALRQEEEARADAAKAEDRLVAATEALDEAKARAADLADTLAAAKAAPAPVTAPAEQTVSLHIVSNTAAAASPAKFEVSLADVRPLLEAAAANDTVLAVHVRCDPEPGFAVHLAARIAGNPRSHRLSDAVEGKGSLRFWIDARRARALLNGAGDDTTLQLILTGSPPDLTAVINVAEATLVSSPFVAEDHKLRLGALKRGASF